MKLIPRCDAITRHHNRFYALLNDTLIKPNVIKVAKGCSTHYRQCGTASSVSPDCRTRQFIPLRGAGDPPSPQPGEGLAKPFAAPRTDNCLIFGLFFLFPPRGIINRIIRNFVGEDTILPYFKKSGRLIASPTETQITVRVTDSGGILGGFFQYFSFSARIFFCKC